MTPALFAGLFFHFMLLSLIAIGGFMATLPGMYSSYLVDTAGLLTPETFAKTVAFGQSLPGPNVLVAAVLGWAAAGPLGALATFGGTSIPFSLIAVLAGRYIREHASSVFVKSYKAGMAPVAVGLLFATAYLLLGNQLDNWHVWAWAGAVTIIVWKTHIPLILLIMIGGVMGLLGCF